MKKGSLGTVHWSGRDLGETVAEKQQIVKCKPTDFFVVGDIVKAACELDFGQSAVVLEVSLGTIMELAASSVSTR